MGKLVPAVLAVLILTVIVDAQIQKTAHNRVFVESSEHNTISVSRTFTSMITKPR